jgi:hypothetical protein
MRLITRRDTVTQGVKWAMTAAATLLAVGAHVGGAQATTWSATTSTVVSVVGSAAAGDVVELASGTYGTVQLADRKAGTVTVRPASGATVSIGVELNSAAYLRFESFTGASTLSYLSIDGTDPSHLEIVGNRFTGQAVVNVTNDSDTAILIDGNTFDGIDACAVDCQEGRLSVIWQDGPGSSSSGVTVSHNHFGGGGCSDGLRIGAYGVVVADNVFDGILQGACAPHVDALQLYGQSHTVVTGNHFRDFDAAIMSPDGGDHDVITDNVIDSTAGAVNAVQFGSVVDTTFAHNTVRGTAVNMDHKTGSPASSGGILRDNIMIDAEFHASSSDCTSCTISHNLFDSSSTASGSNAVIGTPTFVGGANPTTYAGFALASGSAGQAAASDGLDIGIRVVDTTPPDTTIDSGPSDPTTATSASFAFGSSEAGSTFECKLDAGAYASCASPKGYTGLAVGSHTFSVRAIDAASNVDATPATYSWTISAPSVTAPTLVSENEVSSWTTTTASKSTASFAVQAGDVLVAYGMTENSPNGLSISGGSLTWTQQQLVNASNYGRAYAWTATASTSTSITVTFTRSGSGQYGGDVLVFRGSGGIGASAKANATGAPSLSLTTAQASSAVVVGAVDWNAVGGASRAWRTGAGALTETTYATDPAHGTYYGGYHADAGAAGAKTVGLTAPTGQQYSIVAVEVKGA